MDRRAALGIAAGLIALTGCVHDGDGPIGRLPSNKEVKTPKPPKVPAKSVATAQRVEDLGRRIIAQNTFTGLDPLFHTIDVPEVVLFHRGTAELYISNGLVGQCKSEAELAAVLCSELGRMLAEKRSAAGLGRDREPIPEVALPGRGGFNPDPARAAELAYFEKKHPRTTPGQGAAPADPAKLARELLQGAGFDPAELDRVEPLLKQSDRGEALRKQMAGSAPAPTWNK